jgi:MFS family permease
MGSLLVVLTLLSIGNGVVRPGLMSLVTQNVGRHEVGGVLGINQSLASVAQTFAPMLAGILIGHAWLASWASLASGVAAVGLFVAWRGRHRVRELVERHFAGTILPVEERSLRPHLPGCDPCRDYYERHLVLARLDPEALSAQERLARGLGLRARREEESP